MYILNGGKYKNTDTIETTKTACTKQRSTGTSRTEKVEMWSLNDLSKKPRFWTTKIVLKKLGRNANHAGYIKNLWEEEPPHQPNLRRVALESAKK